MANYSAINNIYNYYLTTYAPKSDSKFDTHKKSELRGVYNSIVKMNKDAPLYIVDKSQETKEYAVGLKENARAFHNTIASLGGVSENDLLDKKVAYSSDESLASAKYIGENTSSEEVPSFELEVTKLAKNQRNEGAMIPSNESGLAPKTYSFDIGINGLNYEFQYNVTEEDTNKSVQEKLARLISNSGIGLKANVMEDGNGNSALAIESVHTGTPSDGVHLFNVSDANTSKAKGSVGFLGIDRIVQDSSNAEFLVNGIERQASSNTFTIEKKYEVSLNRVSKDDSDVTKIDLRSDYESLASNVSELISGYNSFIDIAHKYASNHPKSERLVREMSTLAGMQQEDLSSIGVSLMDDGHIYFEKDMLKRTMEEGGSGESLDVLKRFAGTMLRKADQVSLNPMHYADKTVVAYKNPGHNYATPYVTSAYTGMMFNSYC